MAAVAKSTVRARIESFSDGVMAIAITLLALELRVPHFDMMYANAILTVRDIVPYLPGFGAFVLSFVTIAIFWVNHHQLTQHISHTDTKPISRRAIWANIVLMFFVTLIPFAASTMIENQYHILSVLLYAVTLFGASSMFSVLRYFVHHESITALSAQRSVVGPVLYALAIVALLFAPMLGYILLAVPPVYYFLPKRTK